jgi:2-keto-3-deoxy-L-fuconate dehydrogenase
VTSTPASRRSAQKIGAIDILVNAAGYVHHGTVLECSDKDWDFSFDLNVKSMHRTTKAFVPGMLDKGAGSIVNIASGAGSVRGIPNRYVYGATKAAVIGLTKAVAADFIKRGIRANAICPGTIQSPSLDERIADQAKASGQSLEAVRQAFVDRQPMGRLGTAEEIAWLAVYLASDEASYTTGQIHLADGVLRYNLRREVLMAFPKRKLDREPARVTSDPEIMGGWPCVSGTRVPARTIIAELRAGTPTETSSLTIHPCPPTGSTQSGVGESTRYLLEPEG